MASRRGAVEKLRSDVSMGVGDVVRVSVHPMTWRRGECRVVA